MVTKVNTVFRLKNLDRHHATMDCCSISCLKNLRANTADYVTQIQPN